MCAFVKKVATIMQLFQSDTVIAFLHIFS